MIAYIDWTVSPQWGILRWYSVCFALAFFIGYRIVQAMFKNENADEKWLDSLLTYLVVATVLGARLGHCFFYDWDYFSDHILEIFLPVRFEPSFQFIGFRGLASHGGALGILVALWLFSKRVSKTPYLWILDRIVIPIALAGAFIRLGNLMNHEIIGKPTDLPWAFKFALVDDIPRHPVQLYEALSYLSIFFALSFLYWKTSAKEKLGFIFGWFMILLWSARFIMEYFKKSQGGFESAFNLGLSTGQLLSIPFILLGVYLLFNTQENKVQFSKKRVSPKKK